MAIFRDASYMSIPAMRILVLHGNEVKGTLSLKEDEGERDHAFIFLLMSSY